MEKLYDELAIRYLQDKFLVYYFQQWADAGKENEYSHDNLGDFTFIAFEKASVECHLDDLE